MSDEDQVAAHYDRDDLADTILDQYAEAGFDPTALTVDDLSMVDAMHMRGKEASTELAALMEPSADDAVLDLGAGVGGLSRLLASTVGCPVTALDLSPAFCDAARVFNEIVRLEDLIDVHLGSALDLPFDDESFDLVFTQHATMNIADKHQLYSEVFRVLEPGGRFGFYDIMKGPGGDVIYPCPWAEVEDISFLSTPDAIGDILTGLGFETVHWQDDSDVGRKQVVKNREALKSGKVPKITPGFLMGASRKEKSQNIGQNLLEERITLIKAVLRKPA